MSGSNHPIKELTMCCFSRGIERVADTQIFARDAKEGRQFLVYSMKLVTKEDVAMILPLPVPKAPKEDAVRFINLEKYADFFKDMQAGFPKPKSDSDSNSLGPPTLGDPKLKLVEVGSFEASFVPAIKDFARLDERFRLPANVWEQLPQYKDAGFAVFKLKKGEKHIHPMAFEFPRANAKRLFFPTVHIHDGKVHAKAQFDHALYCQSDSVKMMGWTESIRPARMFMKIDKAEGLLDPDKHCYLKPMRGNLKNEDVLV
jgi:hypothetical protein